MRESMRILKHLIINNSINDRDDAELFDLASREDIREELDVMSEEWDFRESIATNAKKVEAYLQCYIIMVILWMFFGGRNSDPQLTNSLRIRDIVLKLDERFSDEQKAAKKEEAQIDFHKIADKWNGNVYKGEGRKQSKIELVKTACRILVRNELVIFADDEDEIRCRKRLSDLMKNYYLSDKRISEINRLFEKEDENANDQSYKNS